MYDTILPDIIRTYLVSHTYFKYVYAASHPVINKKACENIAFSYHAYKSIRK